RFRGVKSPFSALQNFDTVQGVIQREAIRNARRRRPVRTGGFRPPSDRAPASRRLPIGAELIEDGVHFRVWAPRSRRVAVEVQSSPSARARPRVEELHPEPGGYFSARLSGIGAGARYRFRLDSGSFPDPASRFQPEGPHGPSEIVDPGAFKWSDADWRGIAEAQVIYEMHLGTFTTEGTWAGAMEQLPELAA